MSFILSQAGRSFFRAIISPPKFLMFDAYYCCLMLGLDSRQVGSAEDLDTDPFLPAYPEDARGHADLIAGLLIDAELARKDIQSEDKETIERQMTKLIDPTTSTRLNAEGAHLLNLYAAAGLAQMKDRMMPPKTIEEFLIAYEAAWQPVEPE